MGPLLRRESGADEAWGGEGMPGARGCHASDNKSGDNAHTNNRECEQPKHVIVNKYRQRSKNAQLIDIHQRKVEKKGSPAVAKRGHIGSRKGKSGSCGVEDGAGDIPVGGRRHERAAGGREKEADSAGDKERSGVELGEETHGSGMGIDIPEAGKMGAPLIATRGGQPTDEGRGGDECSEGEAQEMVEGREGSRQAGKMGTQEERKSRKRMGVGPKPQGDGNQEKKERCAEGSRDRVKTRRQAGGAGLEKRDGGEGVDDGRRIAVVGARHRGASLDARRQDEELVTDEDDTGEPGREEVTCSGCDGGGDLVERGRPKQRKERGRMKRGGGQVEEMDLGIGRESGAGSSKGDDEGGEGCGHDEAQRRKGGGKRIRKERVSDCRAEAGPPGRRQARHAVDAAEGTATACTASAGADTASTQQYTHAAFGGNPTARDTDREKAAGVAAGVAAGGEEAALDSREVGRQQVREEAVIAVEGGAADGPAVVDAAAVDAAVELLRRRLLMVRGGEECGLEAVEMTEEAEEHKSTLLQLLRETVDGGQNNSILLLGPRGCGKTMVLESALSDLNLGYEDQLSLVRLSGILHADEKVALKAIAQQLCLGHSLAFAQSSTFDDNLCFLRDMLKECANVHRAIVFTLDEFDLFAQRPKQTLLYTLLDVMHSSAARTAVVGITCRLDAEQLLEKRVSSRFSHRRLLFLPPSSNHTIQLIRRRMTLPSTFPHPSYAAQFNTVLNSLLSDPSFGDIIAPMTSADLSPRRMGDLLFRALCRMDPTRGVLSLADIRTAVAALTQQPKMASLAGLSILELYLLVAMKRLEGKERPLYNFTMVFEEYRLLVANHMSNSGDTYTREVALRAFEYLLERELVAFVDGRGQRTGMAEFRLVHLLVTHQEIEEALKRPNCPVLLRRWFSHETVGHAGHNI